MFYNSTFYIHKICNKYATFWKSAQKVHTSLESEYASQKNALIINIHSFRPECQTQKIVLDVYVFLLQPTSQTTDYGRPMKPFFIEIQNFWAWADKLGR